MAEAHVRRWRCPRCRYYMPVRVRVQTRCEWWGIILCTECAGELDADAGDGDT